MIDETMHTGYETIVWFALPKDGIFKLQNIWNMTIGTGAEANPCRSAKRPMKSIPRSYLHAKLILGVYI
jgi:hypothetical protein